MDSSIRMCPLSASQLLVLVLVEAEDDFRALDHDGTADQVGLLHHQGDGFLLRLRKRPFLEDRTPQADEIEKPGGVDVLLQEGPVGRLLVDVDLRDLNAVRVQKTSGVLAGRSSGLGIEDRLGHRLIF